MVLSKSSNGGAAGNREDVIETLIDMDPCGAAYRVSKAMVRIICKSIVVCERSAHLVSILFCLFDDFHANPNTICFAACHYPIDI